MAKATTSKEKPEETTAMAPTGTTEIAEFEGYGEDAGKGRENQTAADYKIPWLEILQPGTPDVAEGKVRAGDIRNNLTGEVFDGKIGIVVTPATTEQKYVEWVDRDEKDKDGREGMIAQHEPTSEFVEKVKAAGRAKGLKFNELPVPDVDKHHLVQTFYMPSIFHHPDGSLQPVMMGFKSTHIKPYQEMQTLTKFKVKVRDADGQGFHEEEPPLYAQQIRMTTEFNKEGGYSWYTPKFGPKEGDSYKAVLLRATEPAFKAAKAFSKLYGAGQAKVDFAAQGAGGGAGKADDTMPF